MHRLKEKFPEQAASLEARGVSALLQGDESSSSSEDEVWTFAFFLIPCDDNNDRLVGV